MLGGAWLSLKIRAKMREGLHQNQTLNMSANYLALLIPLYIVAFLILVGIFQWLWNITMPQVFNLRMIRYWQAFRLLIIAGFLFGNSHLPSFNFKF